MLFYISEVAQWIVGCRMSSDNNHMTITHSLIVLRQPGMFDAWLLSFNLCAVQQYGIIAI